MKIVLAILAVFAGLAGTASAAGYSIGTSFGPSSQQATNYVGRRSFADHLDFDVTNPYNMGSGMVKDLPLFVSNTIPHNSDRLYVVPAVGTIDNGSPAYMGSGGDNSTGTATGNRDFSSASAYAGNAVSAPIPEPREWALMLSGIGLIGAVIRRRS